MNPTIKQTNNKSKSIRDLLSGDAILIIIAFTGLCLIGLIRNQIATVRFDDFPCFYIAAKCVIKGNASDAYPIAAELNNRHPGFAAASFMRPTYQACANNAGFSDPPRFIYPPLLLLIISPIGFLNYESACLVFLIVSIACVCLSAVLASTFLPKIGINQPWAQSVFVLGVCWLPLAWASVRICNTSAISGLFITLAVWGLLNGRNWISGLAVVIAMGVKFTSLPLLAYILLTGKWRVAYTAFISSLIAAFVLIAFLGWCTIQNFINIAPRLGIINQESLSIPSIIIREFGDSFIGLAKTISWLGAICFLTPVVYLSVCLHQSGYLEKNVRCQLILMATLYQIFLIFSVSTHYHYYLYMIPFCPLLFLFIKASWFGAILGILLLINFSIPLEGETFIARLAISMTKSIDGGALDIQQIISFVKNWHMIIATIISYLVSIYSILFFYRVSANPKKLH